VVEVPPSGHKKWMKNKKKASGKKAKKSRAPAKGAPVKKTSIGGVANSTSSLASSSTADLLDKKDAKPAAGQTTSPADLVSCCHRVDRENPGFFKSPSFGF